MTMVKNLFRINSLPKKAWLHLEVQFGIGVDLADHIWDISETYLRHHHSWWIEAPMARVLCRILKNKDPLRKNYGQDWRLSRNGRMNVSGRLISLHRRSVLWLWYICGLAWSKTKFWKNQSEKWTLCGLHAFRPFPLFQSLSLFWRARIL